jgi:hypothetical protein
MIHADSHQTKKHLWRHEYGDLIRIAKTFELIEKYVNPSKGFLVEHLTELSFIRSDSHE